MKHKQGNGKKKPVQVRRNSPSHVHGDPKFIALAPACSEDTTKERNGRFCNGCTSSRELLKIRRVGE
ncbi:hypothetical protein TNCV_2557841 [Trichonephila clavipes]|nr:hypothetical protein TNCV_2557841 [Trichonephila clavipes]